MAYALSITDIQTVKQQIEPELVAKAYLLDDAMFGDLGIKVTTDVENIDVCYIFNRKGLVARPYTVGNVKSKQIAKIVDNPAKVEDYYVKTEDSINRYREKGPFNAVDGSGESEMTQKNLNEIAGRAGEDVRFNVFFGNKANRSLEETPENEVKLGTALFDGVYTIIAKKRTDGTISTQNKNLIITGDIAGKTPQQVYEILTTFYGGLHPAMKKPEQEIYILASDEFCRKAVKGYMLTFPQIAPQVLQAGWKFAEMPNVLLKTSSAMGQGGQLVASVKDNIEFICDVREGKSQIRIGQTNEDLSILGFQINGAATMRIRDYDPMVFACNDAVNTIDATPGSYTSDIFTATSSDAAEGSVTIISGQKDLYQDGDIITIKAEPEDGYKFVGWSNKATANPLNYTFGGGVVNLKAMFEEEGGDSSSSE
jgi:hypothetical protein